MFSFDLFIIISKTGQQSLKTCWILLVFEPKIFQTILVFIEKIENLLKNHFLGGVNLSRLRTGFRI